MPDLEIVDPGARIDVDAAELWNTYHRYKYASPPDPARLELARNRLIENYLPMVRHVAERIRHHLPTHVTVEDLSQEGVFGLVDAIDRFEPDMDIRFKTYAPNRIRGAILDYLRSLDWAPRLVRQRTRLVEDAMEQFRKQEGREATRDELRSMLRLPDDEFDRVLEDSGIVHQQSLEQLATKRQDSDGRDNVEVLAADSAIDPAEQAQRMSIQWAITHGLSRSERLILLLFYYEKMTQKEIGQTLGVSESRVSQMHALILSRLKARWTASEATANLTAAG